MSKAPLVVYHANCPDGFTAAWVFRHFKGNDRMFKGLDVEYFPAKHGDSENLPDTKGRQVWFVDFTYPKEIMMDLIVASKRTTIYDHHKTAKADLDNIIQEIRDQRNVLRNDDKVVFDMSRSGAGITFDELEREHGLKHGGTKPRFNGRRSLWVVDYVEDRDIWNNKLEGVQEFTSYMSTLPMTFETWDDLEKIGLRDVLDSGAAIKKYIDSFGRQACETARMENLGQYRVPTINIPYMNCSEHLNRLAAENPNRDFAAGYFRMENGRWKVSLRSIGDFDVSVVAKTYGGGGHKNAAGFEVDDLPWEKSISDLLGGPMGDYKGCTGMVDSQCIELDSDKGKVSIG